MYMNGPPEGGGDRKFRWTHMIKRDLPVLSQIFHMIIAAFAILDVSGVVRPLIPDLDYDMVSKLPLCA